jgi:hypothetical protein
MLTRRELLALERSTRSQRVLSVYIDGTATDAATQHRWRLDLAHSLRDIRIDLDGAPHDELEVFDQAAIALEHELSVFPHGIGAPGWVAFITARGIRSAERVPVAVPTLATWRVGATIAPYMRILKEARSVIVAVVDARKGRLFRYLGGKLEPLQTIEARIAIGAPGHMGNPPRAGFHHGVHGITGRDAAQRSHRAGTARMLRELTNEALRLAGPDGWILTGGIPEVSRHLAGSIQSRAPGRVHAIAALDIHASAAQIAAAARDGASVLRTEFDVARVAEIVEDAGNGARAALGPAAARSALDGQRVRDLYLTRTYLTTHPHDAEDAIRSALEQGAAVEHVSGDAARALDEHGGLAAHLRSARRDRRPV